MGFLKKLLSLLFGEEKKKEVKNTQRSPEIGNSPTETNSGHIQDRHGGGRNSSQPSKKESTPPVIPVEKVKPPVPQKEEFKDQVFDFEMPDEVPEDLFGFYKSYLKKVNDEFNLMKELEVEFSEDKGLSIYNHETDDLVMTVSSADMNFTMRKNSYIQQSHTKFDSYYIRNLGIASLIFNRFLLENDRKEKVIATSYENEAGKQIVRTYLTGKNSGIKEKMLSQGEFFGVNIKLEPVKQRLQHYTSLGIFKNLDEATIEKGKKLSLEYNLLMPPDALWYFKYLITDCCPRESSGNESELKKFIKISNNLLTMTNFEETNIDGKVSVSCEINGQPFVAADLPEWFSLRLIYQLNAFLLEHFGSNFYVWNWERNPWEQQTFIYLTKEQLEKFKGYDKEFHPLESAIVDFYEGN